MNQQMMDQVNECFNRNMDILISEDPASPTSTAGVAFIINKALIKALNITTHELVPGRALLLKIKWLEDCKTSILNVYAPVNRAAQPHFWQTIENKRRQRNIARLNFVVSDFNIMEEPIDRAPP
jgi:hypothetical protein